MPAFLRRFSGLQPIIAAITASELLHGVERVQDAPRKVHARILADLETRGLMIAPHDLQIAAAGLVLAHEVETLNVEEFRRVSGLKVVDAAPFR